MADYELIYWPTIPGRGEFIRLFFEATSTPYVDHAATSPDDVVKKIMTLINASHTGDATNPAIFAPPILKHGDLILSQTLAIAGYLAPRLGLSGDGSDVTKAHLLAISATIMDGLCVEAHDVHHPIASSKYYEDQKVEAKRRSENYLSERIPKFLGYVQRVLSSGPAGDGPWLYKGSMTYADLIAFLCLEGMLFAFPKRMATLKSSGDYDKVFALYDAVRASPKIKDYVENKRPYPFGDCMWRHYPELDEQ